MQARNEPEEEWRYDWSRRRCRRGTSLRRSGAMTGASDKKQRDEVGARPQRGDPHPLEEARRA
jgi:hypothetical protein